MSIKVADNITCDHIKMVTTGNICKSAEIAFMEGNECTYVFFGNVDEQIWSKWKLIDVLVGQ